MKNNYIKDWYIKRFEDGQRLGTIITSVLIVSVFTIALLVYYTIK